MDRTAHDKLASDERMKVWALKIFKAHLGETVPLAEALTDLEAKVEALQQRKHSGESDG